jgi:hypothetical protein
MQKESSGVGATQRGLLQTIEDHIVMMPDCLTVPILGTFTNSRLRRQEMPDILILGTMLYFHAAKAAILV